MNIMRKYRDENDFWRIRQFLRRVYEHNARRQMSWPVARLDYWRFHGIANCGSSAPIDEVTYLWEQPDGEIIAVLHPETSGEAYLDVDPWKRTLGLEEEMLDTAEEKLMKVNADGGKKLTVFCDDKDARRQQMLTRRGYAAQDKPGWTEYQRRRPMTLPVPETPLSEEFHVRCMGLADEYPSRSWASWKAFHPSAPDDEYSGYDWYANIQNMPLYRRDLDIVAVAPGGEIAGFCTVWFDDASRVGVFEPVGVHPAYQRKGIGKAVMCEGLRRLARLGADLATVGSYSPAAHALYASAGFTEYDRCVKWVKEIPAP